MPNPHPKPATAPSLSIVEGRLDRDAVSAALRHCLDQLIPKTHLDLTYEVRLENSQADPGYEHPEVSVNFAGRDHELLLERNAELLQALEYVALRWIRLDPRSYDRVRFDAAGYRALRIEELRLSASVAAERVRQTRAPFRFHPMSPRERRIVHLALKDEVGIRTASEGEGDERQVVIFPTDMK
ncbi:MAG TPA: R3H domain-containing nucleic acid-binding protein [Methylomirabilota bacterium]|nr:R3H domain-containing nucleic acid-binding protein [Methylomirabilota bacterium]